MGAFHSTWRGVAVVVVLLAGFMAAPSRADPPPPAKATIGDLTFNYNRLNWRIEPAGTGLTATCLQIDCRGVMFDVSVRDGYGECTKDSARETAERLFPMADHHAVNIYDTERFGLVMAQSRQGAALGGPEYVFACLDWQDREYRFAMRSETAGESSWAGGALHYLVSRVTAPPARTGKFRLGALDVPYPTDRWRPRAIAEGQNYWIACLPPTCDDDGSFITASAEASDVGCVFDDRLEIWGHAETVVTPLTDGVAGAPQFSLGLTHSPCRNWVPPRRVACAWHDNMVYRFTAPSGPGCRSGPEVPDDAFLDLVNGASLTP